MTAYPITDWHGLYADGWSRNDLVPDAFSHPAKLARGLAFRIVDHLLIHGWLKAGDVCVDPFGGVATIALPLMQAGIHWTGCELEPKFVALAQANLDLWQARYAGLLPGWGSARIVQGDSRNLAAVLAAADAGASVDALISSPPYAAARIDGQGDEGASHLRMADGSYVRGAEGWALRKAQGGRYGDTPGNLANLPAGDFAAAVSSPPYAGNDKRDFTKGERDQNQHQGPGCFRGTYSRTDGQLGDMPTGSFEAAVSSPPYNLPMSQDHNGRRNGQRGTEPSEPGAFVKYGNTPGQLEGLPPGDFDAAVSSPPYEQSIHDRNGIDPGKLTGRPAGSSSQAFAAGYGLAEGQIGRLAADSFWSASRAIVDQVHQVLRPGGVAVFVVKDYVRNGQRVPFCDQWRQLCEAAGFRTLHVHRAWQVEDHGTQHTLFGAPETRTVERKGFFRRLAERNGSPRIDWEEVICMEVVK